MKWPWVARWRLDVSVENLSGFRSRCAELNGEVDELGRRLVESETERRWLTRERAEQEIDAATEPSEDSVGVALVAERTRANNAWAACGALRSKLKERQASAEELAARMVGLWELNPGDALDADLREIAERSPAMWEFIYGVKRPEAECDSASET